MPNLDSPLVVMRLKVGLTQKDIAQALNRAEQSVRNWEHGKVEPKLTLAEVKTLCRLLGKTLDEMPDSLTDSTDQGSDRSTGLARRQLNLL